MSQERLKTINSATQLLQTLEGGQLHADLMSTIDDTISEMADYANGAGSHKAKGSVTLTIDFDLELDQLRIRTAIKSKSPEQPRRPSILFLTPGNKMSVEQPSQGALPFNAVPMAARES